MRLRFGKFPLCGSQLLAWVHASSSAHVAVDAFRCAQESEAGARKRVNQLFKADFFGEGALQSDEPR